MPFAVKGNNPQGQYNTIKIYHASRGQYEYRFIPVSGNCFSNGQYADVYRQKINLLNDKGAFKPTDTTASGLGVFFKGKITHLTKDVQYHGMECPQRQQF